MSCLRYIKDTKCSQFTTQNEWPLIGAELFAIYQRYEMQSIHNCKPSWHDIDQAVCDISKIRNVVNSQLVLTHFYVCNAVCDISKIRNVVNSQLYRNEKPNRLCCLRYIKDTKCSQFTTFALGDAIAYSLFAIYQRYEMQSIHNTVIARENSRSAVCDISKIRNVVNSQLLFCCNIQLTSCLRYIKDTKCSQFTTKFTNYIAGFLLFAIYQRYEMQSIHNKSIEVKLEQPAVCDISKIRNVVNSQQIEFF